jgi:putative flippase GtrA
MNGSRSLTSTSPNLLRQGVRYGLAGAFVAGVYLLSTTILSALVGMPFRYALAIGFTLQLAVHFTLQRTRSFGFTTSLLRFPFAVRRDAI